MTTIYLAGPLFCEPIQNWHRATKARIIEQMAALGFFVEVIWPGELFPPELVESWGDQAKFNIMHGCRQALDKSDLMVALLDGPQVDDGTAWEVGYAYAKGIRTVGIRTDFRKAGDVQGAAVNCMIDASCLAIYRGVEELLEAVANFLEGQKP